jgi:hypothetical protein
VGISGGDTLNPGEAHQRAMGIVDGFLSEEDSGSVRCVLPGIFQGFNPNGRPDIEDVGGGRGLKRWKKTEHHWTETMRRTVGPLTIVRARQAAGMRRRDSFSFRDDAFELPPDGRVERIQANYQVGEIGEDTIFGLEIVSACYDQAPILPDEEVWHEWHVGADVYVTDQAEPVRDEAFERVGQFLQAHTLGDFNASSVSECARNVQCSSPADVVFLLGRCVDLAWRSGQ